MKEGLAMNLLSIVVPCFNEEETIPIFYNEMLRQEVKLRPLEIEYVFVDDGSSDETLKVLQQLHCVDSRVRFISFSRNFGKEAAIYAGLSYAQGDYVATMDVDLQDPPSLLPEMYNYIKNDNYDCVATRRSTRKGEPPIRSFFAKMFYRLINMISKTEIVDGARDYRLMKRKMVDAILSMKENNRFLKGIYGWVGFKTKWIEYENVERSAGTTKWSFWKLFLYSIEGIVAFSTVPLIIVSFVGIAICIIAFIMFIYIVINALKDNRSTGWPSIMCSIFGLSGIQLFSMGIIGIYLSKIYLEGKKRPLYIVKEDSDMECK